MVVCDQVGLQVLLPVADTLHPEVNIDDDDDYHDHDHDHYDHDYDQDDA